MSQTFTSLSSEAETRSDPSVLKSTLLTGAAWPFIIVQWALALLFHTLTDESLDPEAIKLPCGLTLTSHTGPVWPTNLFGRAFGLNPHV